MMMNQTHASCRYQAIFLHMPNCLDIAVARGALSVERHILPGREKYAQKWQLV